MIINSYGIESQLASVSLPATLKRIGEHAFDGCTALESIEIPNSVTDIGEWAFDCCYDLESVTLPEGITAIPKGCFSGCETLTSVVIPEGVTVIGENAFKDCTVLESVTFPKTLETIESFAFGYCPSLKSVTLPEGLKSIGGYAFYKCSALTSVTIPSTVTSIEYDAFSYCSSLATLTFAESDSETPVPLTIGEDAFYKCSALTSVTLPEGLKSIGECAFYECSALTSVTIPSTVTSIDYDAFSYCISLATLTFAESDSETPVPLTIGSNAFEYCYALKIVTVPARTQQVNDCAFSFCTSLRNVVISEGVKEIYGGAFSCCESLTSVVLPSTLTCFGKGVFQYCTSLHSYSVPEYEGGFTIPESTFYACTSLKDVTIPDSVIAVNYDAFGYCSNMKRLTIPASVTSIVSGAFYSCNALTDIYCFPNAEDLSWSTNSQAEFMDEKATLCHVKADQLDAYTAKFDGVNVTFVGDLDSQTAVTGITLTPEKVELYADNLGVMLHETVEPTNAEDRRVIWTSSDEGVAAVDEYGFVTPVAPGEASVTAKTNDGGFTAVCKVTVSPAYPRVWESGDTLVSLFEDGLVTVTKKDGDGEGAMDDYHDTGNRPWNKKCNEFKKLRVEEGVTSIGYNAFSDCDSLERVDLSEGVKSIAQNAFRDCATLKKVVLPASFEKIEGCDSFYCCRSLSDVYCYADPEKLDWHDDGDDFMYDKKTICHVPEELAGAFAEKFGGVRITFVGDLAVTHVDEVPATCEGEGVIEYWIKNGDCYRDKDCTDMIENEEDFVIPPAGHNWTYEIDWDSVDKTKAEDQHTTVKYWCQTDPEHNNGEGEDILVKFESKTDASCTKPATITFTASVVIDQPNPVDEFEATEKKTFKTAPALGHDWKASWEWDGCDKAKVTLTCNNNKKHTHTQEVSPKELADQRVEPTCTKNGKAVYQAVCTYDGKKFTDEKTEVLPASDHDWGKASYTWSKDNKTCTAKRICKNDKSHVEEETVKTSFAETTPATCGEKGEGIYSAVFKNNAFKPQTKKTEIPATGHKWGKPTYEWNSEYSCKAVVVCENDGDDFIREYVQATFEVTKPATETEDGEGVYTAVFEKDVFETQTKKVVIPATGKATPDEATPDTPDSPDTPDKPDDKPDTNPDDKPDTKPDDKPDTKPDDKPDDKPDTKPDEPKIKGLLGDVNNDGKVDAIDALLILRKSINLEEFTEEQIFLGDVDEDGSITASDALAVLRFSIGMVDIDKIGKEVSK